MTTTNDPFRGGPFGAGPFGGPGDFDDRLLRSEPPDPALRERYERVRRALYDMDLSGPRKAAYAAVSAAGLAGALVCGSLALTEPAGTPAATRAALAVGAAFGMAWCAFGGFVLARWGANLAAHRGVAARMAFGFTLAAVVGLSLLSAAAGRTVSSVPLVTTGLGLLIAAAVLLIVHEVGQAELRTREQILRLECRLAARRGDDRLG